MKSNTIWTVITGTGSYIPEELIDNADFLDSEFYGSDGQELERSNQETIDKFEAITNIRSRRYVPNDLVTSDIAFLAAKDALASSETDKEDLDYIIVAHNFGDLAADNRRSDWNSPGFVDVQLSTFVPLVFSRNSIPLENFGPQSRGSVPDHVPGDGALADS
jgi:hypothetical protein